MLLMILDILKVLGMNTLRWFEVLAKKEEKPRGVSRSKLIKTGLHVCPDDTSTLNREPSGMSPDV